jgi:hypothetical protein
MIERIFDDQELALIPADYPPGILFSAAKTAGVYTAESIPSGSDEANIWLLAETVGAIPSALGLRALSDVRGITVATGEETPRAQGIGLEFSKHLAMHRQRRWGEYVSAITFTQKPSTDSATIRIPHLVSVLADQRIQDTVIWEILPTGDVVRWMDVPLPEQGYFEDRLDTLLALRQRIRMGTEGASGLRTLLGERYLSIKFVYEHTDFFHALFESMGLSQ